MRNTMENDLNNMFTAAKCKLFKDSSYNSLRGEIIIK